jgi:hypothetical protein
MHGEARRALSRASGYRFWKRQDAQNGVPVDSLGARKSRRGLPCQLPMDNPPHNLRRFYRLLARTLDCHVPKRDKNALKALADLGESARLPARAAVPHGLEALAKTTPDESLRRVGIDRLQELQKSEFEEVRNEALISLKKLGH